MLLHVDLTSEYKLIRRNLPTNEELLVFHGSVPGPQFRVSLYLATFR